MEQVPPVIFVVICAWIWSNKQDCAQPNDRYEDRMEMLANGPSRPLKCLPDHDILGMVCQYVKKHGNLFRYFYMSTGFQATEVFK